MSFNMKMNQLSPSLYLLASMFFAAILLNGCGGGNESGSSGSGSGSGTAMGSVNVQLTDAPSCGYDHVYITVDHVAISSDGNGWTTMPVSRKRYHNPSTC